MIWRKHRIQHTHRRIYTYLLNMPTHESNNCSHLFRCLLKETGQLGSNKIEPLCSVRFEPHQPPASDLSARVATWDLQKPQIEAIQHVDFGVTLRFPFCSSNLFVYVTNKRFNAFNLYFHVGNEYCRRFNVGETVIASFFCWHPHGIPPGSSFQDLDRSMLQMVVSTRQLPVWWTRCSREVGCIVNYFGYDRENYIYIISGWWFGTWFIFL